MEMCKAYGRKWMHLMLGRGYVITLILGGDRGIISPLWDYSLPLALLGKKIPITWKHSVTAVRMVKVYNKSTSELVSKRKKKRGLGGLRL